MDFEIVVLFFFIIFHCNYAENKKVTIDEELGSRYQLDLFENVDGSKQVYLQETKGTLFSESIFEIKV